MDREHEEVVQRITARYVAELRAGHHPRLSEYLSYYAQYADAIVDFVTYYHATETILPEEEPVIPPLSQTTRAALDESRKRLMSSGSVGENTLDSLERAANNRAKSYSQLAVEIGLSYDVLRKLEQHFIDAATIPYEVCYKLARTLQQPLKAIESYLGLAKSQELVRGVAEAPASYHVNKQSEIGIQKQTFQEAVEQSMHLSEELKVAWRAILEKEGLM